MVVGPTGQPTPMTPTPVTPNPIAQPMANPMSPFRKKFRRSRPPKKRG